MTLVRIALVALLQQPVPLRDTPATPVAGTAVIAGVVSTDETASHPLRRALVTISGSALRVGQQVVTDDAGRFAFPSLPGGRYTLTAEKPAYVKGYYGAKRPGRPPGTPIVLADGQRMTDIAIRLVRGAVIAGVVLDERGLPIASAQVMTLQPVVVNGQRKLLDVNGALQWATTDERGLYRLYGLPPGEYTVRVGGGGLGGGVQETTPADVQAALRELQSGGAPSGSPDVPGSGPNAVPQVTRPARFFPSATPPPPRSFRSPQERNGPAST